MRLTNHSPARLGACLLALTTAACSPVTRYYTLSPVDAGTTLAAASPAVVAVGPVELPSYIDRPQIVVRTGPNSVKQATFDQWGGDLDDMIPRLLVDDLAARLPGDHVVSFPEASDVAFDWRVPVSISQFDVSESGEAVVTARWQLRGPGGVVQAHESVVRAQAAGKGYDERVAALSRALGNLSGEIAAALAPLRHAAPAAAKKAN